MVDAAIAHSYSEVAERYIRMFGAIDNADPEDLGFLERNLGPCDGTVLDAGCGPGHLTAYLADLGVAARGIDLVPDFIDRARSAWSGVDFSVRWPIDEMSAALVAAGFAETDRLQRPGSGQVRPYGVLAARSE